MIGQPQSDSVVVTSVSPSGRTASVQTWMARNTRRCPIQARRRSGSNSMIREWIVPPLVFHSNEVFAPGGPAMDVA